MKDYKLLSSKKVYVNPWITVREDQVIRPGGKEGIFGVVEMKPGSTVLALNSENEAYLIKEYKYAVDRDSIELMSGGLDENETPLKAAKRELKEETGLRAERWVHLGVVDPFTTVIKSPNYMFLALGVKEGRQRLEEGEMLQVIKLPFRELIKMVMEGQITHSASCVCILKAAWHLGIK